MKYSLQNKRGYYHAVISYKDEKIYVGQVLKGLMNGYGEFSWKNGKNILVFIKIISKKVSEFMFMI